MHEDDELGDQSGLEPGEILSSATPRTADVLPGDPDGRGDWADPESSRLPRGRRRGLIAAGAAVLVLGAGAGAYAVGAALSGGGTQPEAMVPATAVAYAELDLDPSATQKVEAFGFLRKFPQLADTFTEDGMFGPGFEGLFSGSTIDYAVDVQPWLGRRVAVALVPGGASTDPAAVEVVIQSTDDDAARTSLERLVSQSDQPNVSVVVRDGYAIVAAAIPSGSFGAGAASFSSASVTPIVAGGSSASLASTLSAQASSASLESNDGYTAAVQPYGSGVATFWSDNAAVAELTGTLVPGGLTGGGDASKPTGQSVAVVRFDGGTLEVVGRATGQPPGPANSGVPAFLTLPDSTLAAFAGSGLGERLRDAYGPLVAGLGGFGGFAGPGGLGGLEGFGSLERAGSGSAVAPAGLESGTFAPSARSGPLDGPLGDPDSWPTLFGDQTVVAVGGDGAKPSLGVHVVGGAATVKSVVTLVADLGSESADVVVRVVPDGVVVASDRSWADALASGGALGDSARFRDAVPDAERASVVGYVDINGIVKLVGDTEDASALKPLAALGVASWVDGDSMNFRLRLLTN